MTLSIPSDIWKPDIPGYNVPECTVFTVPEKQNAL